MPQCGLYDGTRDPGEHVYQFETNMLLIQVSDAVMCRTFPTTLRKAAHAWFKSLQPRSIYSFGQLSDLFQKHFISSRSRRKNSAIYCIPPRPSTHIQVRILCEQSPPGNMKSLLEKANKYIQAEEYLETHRGGRGEGNEEQKKRYREITPLEGKSAKRSKHDERRPKDPFAWEKLTTPMQNRDRFFTRSKIIKLSSGQTK
ncbi:hypothetical protein RJ639_002674 [Escallonia herrerae]|uniref:Retrotransposon gag domain-containing protein n=1 Tax=Escallonia herrerae TaxID=1293975 RepID=A0AA88XB14_9ASTE|nr:hypothetical protein RJ639_002674 [Escallonia herrerae]